MQKPLSEPGDSGPHQRKIIRTIDTGFNEVPQASSLGVKLFGA
jgi:hypothetical protein